MNPTKGTKPKQAEQGCLVCKAGGRLVRGLCDVHYRRFLTRRREIAETEGEESAERFEADCLADGWVLPKTKGGRKKELDPFDVIAERIVRESRQGYRECGPVDEDDLNRVVEEGKEVIRKAVAHKKAEELRKNSGRRKSG